MSNVTISTTHSDPLPAWFMRPDSELRGGIVILHEIFGLNAAMEAEVQHWVDAGYAVVAPALFHRQQADVALGYAEADRAAALLLWEKLDLAAAVADSRSCAEWLGAQLGENMRIAAMGFCLGGQLAVLAGPAFDAVIAFYPVRLQNHPGALKSLPCPVLVHLGEADNHAGPAVIAQLQEEAAGGADACLQLYPNAGHAFYNCFRSIGYLPDAAALARRSTADFLHAHIG